MPNIKLNNGAGVTLNKQAPTLSAGKPTITLGGAAATTSQALAQTLDELEQQDATDNVGILADMKKSAVQEVDRFIASADTGFWFAVAFQTREAKDEFLRKAGLVELGDKYLCGEDVARLLGITIEAPIPPRPNWKNNRRLVALSDPMLPTAPTNKE